MPFFSHENATSKLFTIGDSRTAGTHVWRNQATGYLNGQARTYALHGSNYGVEGATVASMKTYIDSNLSGVTEQADLITINLGAVDVTSMPAEATWKANLNSIIASLQAKWPAAPIYIARPWQRNYTAESNTLAGWIADVVTAGSKLYLGTDERVWMEGGDDGATMTSDGVHYSAAGELACAVQWKAAFGL